LWREEKSLSSVWNRTPAIQLDATPNALSWLLFVRLFFIVPHCYTNEHFNHIWYERKAPFWSENRHFTIPFLLDQVFQRNVEILKKFFAYCSRIIHPDVLPNGVMINEWWTEMNLEGTCRIIEVLS
jgi:hypothetical protein